LENGKNSPKIDFVLSQRFNFKNSQYSQIESNQSLQFCL